MLAQADDDRRSRARGDYLPGSLVEMATRAYARVMTLTALERLLPSEAFFGKFFDEVGDDFRIGLGLRTYGPRREAAFSARCSFR